MTLSGLARSDVGTEARNARDRMIVSQKPCDRSCRATGRPAPSGHWPLGYRSSRAPHRSRMPHPCAVRTRVRLNRPLPGKIRAPRRKMCAMRPPDNKVRARSQGMIVTAWPAYGLRRHDHAPHRGARGLACGSRGAGVTGGAGSAGVQARPAGRGARSGSGLECTGCSPARTWCTGTSPEPGISPVIPEPGAPWGTRAARGTPAARGKPEAVVLLAG